MPNVDLIPKRPEYYVQTGSMFENPHGVPKDEIVAMILENPAEVSAQVVFGKYVESSGLVFSGEIIQAMIDRSSGRVVSDIYRDPEALALAAEMRERTPDHMRNCYATGVDFARQTDFTVITTLDIRERPAKCVYWRRLNRVPWETIYTEVGRARHLFGPSILIDSTGPGGDVIYDALESRWYCPVHDRCNLVPNRCQDRSGNAMSGCSTDSYHSLSCVDGFYFTGTTKKLLVEHLRNMMSVGYRRDLEEGEGFGWIRTPPIVQLEEEMSFYIWDDKGLETDALFSLALAAYQGLDDPIQPALVGSPWAN
jgi:hypothetical protein